MTLLPLHIAQSSLGQRCASYFAFLSDTLHQRLVSPLLSAEASSSSSSLSSFASLPSLTTFSSDWAILNSGDPSTILIAILACVLVFVTMSWRFGDFFRRGPYAKVPPPHISDSDYTYLTPEDIVDPPAARPFAAPRFPRARDDDAAPDTILLKHRQKTYALNFPAYAINDGALSVGDLRHRTAEVTGTSNPARVKLLYKGKLLDDDAKSCRAEGLKQQSEVLCVVSEVQPGERTPSEGSDAEGQRVGDHPGHADETPAGEKKKRNRNRHKNKKKGKNRKSLEEDRPSVAGAGAGGAPGVPPASFAPPADQKKPSTSTSSISPSAPNLKTLPTALDQVNALVSYLRTVLLPLCDAYVAHPPTEAKARDFEHKKLTETIFAQVILKGDGLDLDGDEAARSARRALIKEAQTALTRLDQAAHV